MTEKKKGQWGGNRPNQTGRPKGTGKPIKDPADKAKTVSLSLSADLHARLAECAETDGLTVNDAIREAITAWVKRKKR